MEKNYTAAQDTNIKLIQKTKDLRVWFDFTVMWRNHIQKVRKKSYK